MKTYRETLDVHHNQQVQKIAEKTSYVQKITQDLERKNATLKREEAKKKQLSDADFEKYLQLKDDIAELEKQVAMTKDCELDYYLDSGPILFRYYDIIENRAREDSKLHVGSNSILKYFVSAEKRDETPKNDDRATLLEKYMSFNDENFVPQVAAPVDACPYCGSTNRQIFMNEGLISCNDCHTIENMIVDNDRPSYKDPPKEISYFAYKRLNHLNESKVLNEWLQFLIWLVVMFQKI